MLNAFNQNFKTPMPVTVKYRTLVKHIKIGCGFRFQWLLVTILGFLVSLCLVEVGERPDLGVVEGAIGGAAIGVAQWFVLRQQFSQALWWVLATIVAWGLIGGIGIGALGWVAPRSMYIPFRVVYGTVDGAQLGALIGAVQWLFLRNQVESAWRWIWASSVAWSLGLAFGWSVGAILRHLTGVFLGEVVGLALGWVVVAAITGFALFGLLGDFGLEKLPRRMS